MAFRKQHKFDWAQPNVIPISKEGVIERLHSNVEAYSSQEPNAVSSYSLVHRYQCRITFW